MSFYGNKTFVGYFSLHKTLLAAGNHYRYGAGKPLRVYKLSDKLEVEVQLTPNGVFVVDATEADCVSIQLAGINPSAPSTFENIELVDIADSYTLQAGKYAVALEGTFVCSDGVTYESEDDLHLIQSGENVKTLTGNGKVIVLNFTP